ncbi:MAG: hypothetical protein ACRD01_02145 [Terriglobales bacterium]
MTAQTVWVVAAWYVFSAVVSGMSAPTAKSGPGYQWTYHTLHVLAGDLSKVLIKNGGQTNGVDLEHQ